MDIDRVVLAERPKGEPNIDNFRLEKVEASRLKEGELLLKVIWLSFDKCFV